MKGSFGRVSLMLLLACAAVTFSVHACKEPTQVTVDIRTLGFKCQELKKVTVVVAGDPSAAEGKWQYPQAEVGQCQGDNEVGTLVITPSSDHGAVMVLASYSESPCVAPDYLNCIVARRQFAFIENVPLRLPITLEASCKNVPCNALSSCRSGACVSSEADCNDTGTCAAPSEPVVADDGGVIPPPGDATLDIPPNDAFVPPDAPRDVTPFNDAGKDSGSDATPQPDGSLDANSGTPGNSCPTYQGPQDCTLNSQVCCAYQYIYCGNPPTLMDSGSGDAMMMGAPTSCQPNTSAPFYPCTGRLHCPTNQYCCAGGTYPQSSLCVMGSCGTIICNTNADCPSGMQCTGIQFNGMDGAAIRKCM